jgi:uncharacterized protein YebE (UPF0316 family)
VQPNNIETATVYIVKSNYTNMFAVLTLFCVHGRVTHAIVVSILRIKYYIVAYRIEYI